MLQDKLDSSDEDFDLDESNTDSLGEKIKVSEY